MPQTIYKSVVVCFQNHETKYHGNACKGGSCSYPDHLIGFGHLSFRARVETQRRGRLGFKWVHWHWSCVTGLQFGGIRDFLRGGEKSGEYPWHLFGGLLELPAEVQEIVKEAVRKGHVEDEHKAENIQGKPILRERKKKAEETRREAPGADNDQAGIGDQTLAVKDESKPAVRKPKLLRGKAAAYRGLPVCFVCQSNDHAHKDCPRSRINREIAEREAFASGVLPQNFPRYLPRHGSHGGAGAFDNRSAANVDEAAQQGRTRVLIPAQPVSLFNMPSNFRMQTEVTHAERLRASATNAASSRLASQTPDVQSSPTESRDSRPSTEDMTVDESRRIVRQRMATAAAKRMKASGFVFKKGSADSLNAVENRPRLKLEEGHTLIKDEAINPHNQAREILPPIKKEEIA